jgi:plastocyanin
MTTSTIASRPSHRLARTFVAAVAVLGLMVALGACGDDENGSNAGSSSAGTSGSGTADATLEVDSIAYHDVTAPAGGTLEIVNTSGTAHTFTADDGSFDVEYGADDTITVDVPAEPGDYPFHCEIHSSMTATLTVE